MFRLPLNCLEWRVGGLGWDFGVGDQVLCLSDTLAICKCLYCCSSDTDTDSCLQEGLVCQGRNKEHMVGISKDLSLGGADKVQQEDKEDTITFFIKLN